MYLIIFVLAFLAWFLCIIYQHRQQRLYFESKGIFYLGNGNLRFALNALSGGNHIERNAIEYAKLKVAKQKIGGSIDFRVRTLLVGDTALIKSLLVRDFEHFVDRSEFLAGMPDYLFRKMLFLLTGDKWKELRSKLSPAFTAGKIKKMLPLFEQSGKNLLQFFESELKQSKSGEIDLLEGFSKLTLDVLASAACGIDSKAFNQKEASLFEAMADGLQVHFCMATIFKMLALVFFPTRLVSLLRIAMFKRENQDFFNTGITRLIQSRELSGERRDDFVQLMLDVRAGKLKSDQNDTDTYKKFQGTNYLPELLDDEGVVSNGLQFVIIGADTSRALLAFCSYALALNMDVQERLRSEINLVYEKCEGQITYDDLNGMHYLDMVINESLRLYPPAPLIDRRCTQDYEIPGTRLTMRRGDIVTVPIYCLHRDADYFPDPEKFDPERFSADRKNEIDPYAFMPFGHGPRTCIGMRFVLLQTKLVMSYLVHYYKIEPSQKTQIPMKFSAAAALSPKHGMHLKLSKIKNL